MIIFQKFSAEIKLFTIEFDSSQNNSNSIWNKEIIADSAIRLTTKKIDFKSRVRVLTN